MQGKKQSILPPFAVPPYVAALPKLLPTYRKWLWLERICICRTGIALPKINPATLYGTIIESRHIRIVWRDIITTSKTPECHQRKVHVLDMFLGYVQKIGFCGHVFAICSFREHVWRESARSDLESNPRAPQLGKRLVRRNRPFKHRGRFELSLRRPKWNVVVWLIWIKRHRICAFIDCRTGKPLWTTSSYVSSDCHIPTMPGLAVD